MKKIRLDPETLAVQSFATMGLPRGRGTVRGAQDVVPAPTRVDIDCGWTHQGCESGDCEATGICLEPSELCVDTARETCAGMPGC